MKQGTEELSEARASQWQPLQADKIHRVAVVGCGMLAQGAHLPNIQSNPRLHLAVTCDLDLAVAEECRDRFGADRAESDWRRVVEASDVDLIVLATHTDLRGELIIPALRAGKPVYTEKPLSASRCEMIEIVRTSRATGTPVCVGHNRRSSPAVLEFKRLLDKAREHGSLIRPTVDRGIGRAALPEEGQTLLLMRINDDVRSWKDWIFWDEDGIMFAEMVHFIDLALWLHSAPPVRVFAEGSPRGNFMLMLRFADGSLANFHHTFVGNFDYPKELIEATVNNVTLALEQHLEVKQCGLADEPLVQGFPYHVNSPWAKETGLAGYFAEMEAEAALACQEARAPRWLGVEKGHGLHLDRFVTHLEGRGPNPCDVESSIPVNRIALKFLESARLGMPIAVGPEDWHIPA